MRLRQLPLLVRDYLLLRQYLVGLACAISLRVLAIGVIVSCSLLMRVLLVLVILALLFIMATARKIPFL